MIAIIDCGTSWLQEIIDAVTAAGHEYEVIEFQELLVHDMSQYKGVIISGAPTMLTESDIDYYLDLFKFVKAERQPVLGICLGHQVMGMAYGAEIAHGPKIDKMEDMELSDYSLLFVDIDEQAKFREEHAEHITLPREFSLIAKSESCANEAMQHKAEPKFGVQFHPEVSGAAGKKLIKNFLELCH